MLTGTPPPKIGQVGFDLDRTDVGEWHPQVLGLATGEAAEHVGEAEEARRRMPHRLASYLGIGIGRVVLTILRPCNQCPCTEGTPMLATVMLLCTFADPLTELERLAGILNVERRSCATCFAAPCAHRPAMISL